MDAIEPFDYSDLKPFSTAYLPGFLADRYDEDDKKCAARVLTRMKNSTAAALHDTLGGYTGVQTLSEQIDSRTLEPHYALLPVWMLHTRWKEQDFLFAMNGQTGKLIGDLPVDKGRVAAWFAGISIPLMILTALISAAVRGGDGNMKILQKTVCPSGCGPALHGPDSAGRGSGPAGAG